MINITNLEKSFPDRELFSEVTLKINPRERIGLIGRNGSGKSTFLSMLANSDDRPKAIDIAPTVIIKTLEQSLNFTEDTILKQVCTALPKNKADEAWKAKAILMGLGFSLEDFDRAPAEFSSGFQIRIRLAEALVTESDLLLLDEPTNYLDIVSLRWLARFLKNWHSAFILVTHDRHFMSEVVTHTIGIHRCRFRKMKGGPQKLIDHFNLNEEIHEKSRKNQEKKHQKNKEFISKFRAGARSAGLVQSRIKALAKIKINEKLVKIPEIKFHFKYEPFRSNMLINVENLSFAYPDQDKLIQNFTLDTFPGDKIAVIGPNGQGKSTILKLLTQQLKPQSGTIKKNNNLKIGYYGADSLGQLDPGRTILAELGTMTDVKEQEVRNVCGSLLFSGEDAKKRISMLSGGEKSRVCLGKILLFSSHLLILDEPTNHLDLESSQALMKALKEYAGTVIFVTHNEEMVEKIANRLVVFEQGAVSVREQTYAEFLEAGGWTEEIGNELSKSKTKDNSQAKKDNKKLLRQNKKQQAKIEREINKLDQRQSENSKELIAVCYEKNYDKIKTLGEEAKANNDRLGELYQELEKLIEEEEGFLSES